MTTEGIRGSSDRAILVLTSLAEAQNTATR